MRRKATLSDGAMLLLESAAKGWVHRSVTTFDDVWHISPGRGNGHKAIGRTPAGQKLIREGKLTDETFPKLTDEGREALSQARREGRRLDYGVGRKPSVVQGKPQSEEPAEARPAEAGGVRIGPQLTEEEKRKRLHIQTSGSMTYVCIFGKVIGTVAEVRNSPGLRPEKVFEANSRERGVHQERRNDLNAAVSAVLRR